MTDRYPDTPRTYWPDELCFPETTFAARLAPVQADLARTGLAGVLIFDPENMFWLTGYQTIGYFTFQAMFVPASGQPLIVTRIVNRDVARALPTISDAIAVSDTEDHIDVLARVLRRSAPHGPVGYESKSRYLNVHDHARLSEAAGPVLLPWDGCIEAHRLIKSAEELDRIRQAARCVEAGMEAAIAAIAPGTTDNAVAAALYQGSIAAGSEYIGHPPMVVSGTRSALCFALWRRKTIERGDVVLLEGAGCIDRYHAIMARTAIVGPPEDRHKAAAEALIDVLETAVSTIRPGVTAGEVDRICRARMEARGFGASFRSRTAYGIGIGFPPNWAEGHIYAIRPEDPLVLRANMTFHVIPTLFFDSFGMAISDSVVVTDSGCDVLTRAPRDLIVVT
ncbi:MAG: Xaa-Pro peptidase family protein [Pseudomonadota bacterium]